MEMFVTLEKQVNRPSSSPLNLLRLRNQEMCSLANEASSELFLYSRESYKNKKKKCILRTQFVVLCFACFFVVFCVYIYLPLTIFDPD